MSKLFLLLPVALAIAACATDSPEHREPVVRDSAGIRIVENTTPQWQEGEVWRLSPEPVVDIGGGDREEEQLFRVVGALRLSDDRIVVANGGTNEIRFYGPEGAFLSASGSEGEGPGEFRWLYTVARLRSDSLVAYDGILHRATIFDANGNIGRTTPIERRGGLLVVGALQDGSLVGMRPDALIGRFGPGVSVDSGDYVAYGLDGAVDTIARFPRFEVFFHEGRPSVLDALALGRAAYGATGDDRIYLGWNDSYEIGSYSRTGKLLQLTRLNMSGRPLTADMIETYTAERVAGVRGESRRRRLEEYLSANPWPENLPAFREIRIDRRGNLWVEDYPAPGTSMNFWSVFDVEGFFLGRVTMPAEFSPLDIGPDYVLGVWRDADDVEHVRMYELVKP